DQQNGANDQQRRAGARRRGQESRQAPGKRLAADDVVDGDLERYGDEQRERRIEQAEKKNRGQVRAVAARLVEQSSVDRERAVAPARHQSSFAPDPLRLETIADIAAAES